MITIGKKSKAVWCETEYNGSKIKMLLCPVSSVRMNEIRKENTSREAVLNSETKAMELVDYLDKVGNAKTLADEIIQDVEGFADENGKKLELTPEAKYEIYLLPKQEIDKRSLCLWIMEQAGVLQVEKEKETEADEKNS